jgi:Rrf2 family protein
MMLDLARHYENGPVPMHDISHRQDISIKYLEQIAIPLRKAKLIRSARGPHGGQMLAVPPGAIRIGDIVRILEKEFSLAPCIEEPTVCERAGDCVTRNTWERATTALYEKLDAVTLKDMVDESKQVPEV